MKNIFRSLGVLTLLLALVGHAFAVNFQLKSGAKVRYGIEKLKVSQNTADDYAQQGYVDLWAYAMFNKGYWETATQEDVGTVRNLVVLTNGKVTSWAINITMSTHSYWICDNAGNYQTTGSIMFAGPSLSSTCTDPNRHEQDGMVGVVGPDFINGSCPSYAYSASGSATTFRTLNGEAACAQYVDIWTDENGEEWYRLKLYQIRYEYPKVNNHGTTFYTRFYCGASATGDAVSNGASTLQASYNGTTNPIFGIDNWHTSDADWSHYQRTAPYNPDLYNFVIGGVEVIADPEFLLTASATCGGSDLQGNFKVNNWNGKSWSDYKAVKMYVNTDGGIRKALAIGTDLVFSGTALCNASGTITATGTAADFNYSLIPSAYMMPDGTAADSLIWAFEEKKMMLI